MNLMFNENFKIRHLIIGSIGVAVWLYIMIWAFTIIGMAMHGPTY